ncbi:MAG: glycyl-radical enzyme activating protein [Lachnospiraceae bacterium]|jgi:glycyl-radical enzyme activating protein
MDEEKLLVFDLQRFALHDGPGIRTTVFLKGCPLDCLWCHNPESKRAAPQLGFLEKKCTGCGRCSEVCGHGVYVVENGRHTVHFDRCVQCGECVKACPAKALKIYGQPMTADEILQIAVRDRDFYERSGGGLTVSGGEPMLQYAALRKLLEGAKKAGLHVCLDTSGQAPTAHYEQIAPYVDLFLYDYKLTDPAAHRRYTGRDNSLVLHNLDRLGSLGSRIYLRCPIIPGINDNEEHYRAIARLSRRYDNIEQVNLMMYHDMARGKAGQIGTAYPLAGLKSITGKQKENIYEQVRACGCLRLQEC